MNTTFVLRPALLASLIACSLAAGLPASAAELAKFGARLSGAAEVPPNMSTGSGMLDASLDQETGIFSWTLSYRGLTGPVTEGHFHGPAMASENAAAVIPFDNGTANPIEGQTTLSAVQITDLLAGKWYVNLHTSAHPGGEIRGQVTATPPNPTVHIKAP